MLHRAYDTFFEAIRYFSVGAFVIAFLAISGANFKAWASDSQPDQCVILGNHSPPVSIIKDDGLDGIGIEMLEELFVAAGYDFNRCEIQPSPWARIYEGAKRNSGQIVIGLAKTKNREELFKWVGPIYQVHMSLIAMEYRAMAPVKLSDLEGQVVGAMRQTGPAQILEKSEQFSGRLQYSGTPESNLKKLMAGRIDYFAHVYPMAVQTLKDMGLSGAGMEPVLSLGQVDLYFAFSTETDDQVIHHLQDKWDQLYFSQATSSYRIQPYNDPDGMKH